MTAKPAKTGDFHVPTNGYMDPAQATDSKQSVPAFLQHFGVKPGEWLYALKTDLRVFMRPGYDLRVRVYACIMEFTRGYRSEFAMMRVGREDKEDKRPKFVPITPGVIADQLWKVAKAEFRKTLGQPLTDAEAEEWRIEGKHIRRVLESMETQDGTVTAVTVTRFLAQDEATRKLGNADVQLLMTNGLPYKDALAQKLIAPICGLSQSDRKRLAGKSFLYLHVTPRPATIAALTRRTMDDFTGGTSNGKELQVQFGKPVQLVFKLVRARGIDDPNIAAQFAERAEVREALAEIARGESIVDEAKGWLENSIDLLVQKLKAGEEIAALPPPAVQSGLFPPQIVAPAKAKANGHQQASTDLNSNGSHEERGGTRQTPTTAARSVDPETGCTPEEMDAEVHAVLGIMRKYSAADAGAASDLIKRCRANAPNCTAVAICEAVQVRGPVAKGKTNPVGLLLAAVPKLFVGGSPPKVEETDSMEANVARRRAGAW